MAKYIRIIPWLDEKIFNNQLSKLGRRQEKVKVDINSSSINNATQSMNQLNNVSKNTNTTFGKLKTALKETFSHGKLAMTGYLMALNEINKAARQAKETILELDSVVTDLSVAMNDSRDKAYDYLQTLNQQAKELKITTETAAKASDNWLRQGRTIAETNTLVRDSTVLSVLGQIDSADASKYLTSTLNGYKLAAEDAISVVDKLTQVDAMSASSAGSLAETLSKTASAAQMAGVEIDTLIGYAAAIQNTTQDSGSEIGNALKGVFSRFNNIKVGKFLDDESGEALNDVEKTLSEVGIKMRDANGAFIDNQIIIDQLGKSWDSFDSVQQRAIATAAAGMHRYNSFIALMQNYDKALQYTEASINSSGTALEKYERSYLNSIEAQRNSLQASFETVILNSDFDEIYSGILSATTALLDFINQTNALKGVLTALTVSGAIKGFMVIKTGIQQAYVSLNQFQQALTIVKQTSISTQSFERLLLLSKGLSSSQLKLIVSSKSLSLTQKELLLVNSGLSLEEAKLQLQTWGLAKAQTGLIASSVSLKSATRALFSTLLANPLVVVTAAITAATMAWSAYQQHLEKVKQAAQEMSEQAEKSSSHAKSLLDLRKQLKEGTASAEELTTAFREQMRTMGYTESQIDSLIAKYGNLSGAIDEATRKSLENARTDAYADMSTSGRLLVTGAKGKTNVSTYYSQNKELSEQIRQMLESSPAILDGGVFRMDKNASAEDIYSYYNTLKDISQLIHETAMETGDNTLLSGDSVNPTPYYQISEALDALSESAELYGEAVNRLHNADAQLEVADYLKFNDISSKEAFDNYVNSIKNNIEYSEAYKQVLLEVANNTFPQFSAAVKTASDAVGDLSNQTAPSLTFTELFDSLDKAKEKLSTLDSAYAKLFDAPDENTSINYDDYSAIYNAFSEVDGIDDYITKLEDAGQNTEKVKATMEELIGAYLDHSKILDNVNDKNKDFIITMLEEMGVINAGEIVLAAMNKEVDYAAVEKEVLAIKTQFATEKSKDFSEATIQEANNLIQSVDASEAATVSLARLALEKINVNNNPISTIADINNVIALANAAHASGEALEKLKWAKDNLNAKADTNKGFGAAASALAGGKRGISQGIINNFNAGKLTFEYEELTPEMFTPKISPNVNFSPDKTIGTATSDAMSDAAESMEKAAEKMKEVFEDTVDFFEQRAKVLNNALDLLKANLENVSGAFSKNKLIDSQIGINSEKINNYTDAMAMYTQKANEALSKLPVDIAEKIQNGAVDLTTFIGDGNEEVVEAVKDYQNWADKVADCKQELAELKQVIEDLELQKFENIAEDFQNMFDIREDKKGTIEKQIALFKEAGELIGESFYTAQIDQTKKQLDSLNEQKTKLVEQMNSALASGRVTVGSEAWLEMIDSLTEVDGKILDCKKSIEEFDNAILALHTEIFNRIQQQFSNFHSELSNMEGLFDDFDVSDGHGNWTDEAITRLGLLAQQYEMAKYQVAQYNVEIDKLNQDYMNGKYSATEYADRLAELTQQQWESVNASESAKDSIYELNEIRINEEIETINEAIDAYRELIDAKIEELRAEQDLYHWKQKVADANKTITDLERQIAAMSGDNSAATVAKRKQLESQLAEARKDLENQQYDHSIDEQEKALEEQFTAYENERLAEIETLELSLEQKEQLIFESFETVKANAEVIGKEITEMANNHGIEMSESLTSAWKTGENAIASYGHALNAGTSQFISNLISVETQTWQLQAQANATAQQLAYMFATKADNLVAQLQASYTNEANLAQMTMALRDSLINTLERGYNISSITSALDTIAKSAENATSKIRQMNTEMGNKSTSNTEKRNWRLVDGMTGKVLKSGMTKSEAEVAVKTILPMGGMGYIETYAKGGIVSKDDKNPLNNIAKAVGEDTLIAAKEGEGVFTAEQTKLLQGFMNNLENPKPWTVVDAMKNPNKNNNYYSTTEPMRTLSDVKAESPQVADKNMNNNVNMNYGSLITVNGDVNDTKHFLGQMENICTAVVNKSWKDATRSLKYGF